MADFKRCMMKLRSQRKRLAEEIACPRGELRVATRLKSRGRLSLRRRLKGNATQLKENKEHMQWMRKEAEVLRNLKDLNERVSGLTQMMTDNKIISAFAFHCRCLHDRIAQMMDLEWVDLDKALVTERDRHCDGTEGDWWEEKNHREVLVHLQALGFRKEQWECSLVYSSTGDFCDVLCMCTDSFIREKLQKDLELLNSERADVALSPVEKQLFSKFVDECEAYKLL